MGGRAYSIIAPKYWNNLPDEIKDLNLSLDIFKKRLKKLYIMFMNVYESGDHGAQLLPTMLAELAQYITFV